MHVVYPPTFCITIVFDFPCDDCNTQEEPDWKQWLCKILGAKQDRYRAFSLTWPASMQMYWNNRKRLHKKSSNPTELSWYTNMAAVLLLWDTNMAAVTSCENTL